MTFNFGNARLSIYKEIIFQAYLAKDSIDQSKLVLEEYQKLSTGLNTTIHEKADGV